MANTHTAEKAAEKTEVIDGYPPYSDEIFDLVVLNEEGRHVVLKGRIDPSGQTRGEPILAIAEEEAHGFKKGQNIPNERYCGWVKE